MTTVLCFELISNWLLTRKHPASYQTMPPGLIREEEEEEEMEHYIRLNLNLMKSQTYLGLKIPLSLVIYF